MIVESSRDAAPDGGDGALSSPINLAYFYGASPHSSEGSCSPAHSAPGSPGSDSDLSVSSRGGGRRDPRGGARPALQGTACPGGGPGTPRPAGRRGRRRRRARSRGSRSLPDRGGGEKPVAGSCGLKTPRNSETRELQERVAGARRRPRCFPRDGGASPGEEPRDREMGGGCVCVCVFASPLLGETGDLGGFPQAFPGLLIF